MKTQDEIKSSMEDTIEHYKKELRNLRTGRPNPGMLDDVTVEVYGAEMRLKELASVSISEGRQLVVTPFDPQTAGPISKGIEKANLNVQPILEGNLVRVPVPPLSEEVRRDIVKQGKKKAEDTKISIRDSRRRGNEILKKQKSDGEITEDIQKKSEKLIQELTDKYCKTVDDLFSEKEKDIMEV